MKTRHSARCGVFGGSGRTGAREWIAGLLGAVVIAGCSTGEIEIETPELPPDAAMAEDLTFVVAPLEPPPPPPAARLFELRSTRWPGGGRELIVGVLDERTGRPFPEDLSSRIVVDPPDGLALRLAVTRHAPPPGYTLLLLPASGTPAQRRARADAARIFIAARSPAERIALYANGAFLQRFSGFQLDRAELLEALDRYRAATEGGVPLPIRQAVSIAAAELRAVGGEGPDVMRSVVVLDGQAGQADAGGAGVFVTSAPPVALGVLGASAAIDEARRAAFYRVAACGPPEKFGATIAIEGLRGSLAPTFSATLPEELGAACDPGAIDSARRTYTPRIEFVFDMAQRTAYEARVRATQKGTFDEDFAKTDFETQVRLAPGQPPVHAVAHLRGQSSLLCERKSYTLKLDGAPRHLLPDAASDEYLLVSMCDDPAYTFAPTVFDLLDGDLFRIRRRFVELVIDGKTRGIYLLLEKTRESLVRDDTRVTTVMRRDYPANGREQFEVEFRASGDPGASLLEWAAFEKQIAPLQGAALLATLQNALDLDQYLRFLANESILKSGDYIDEVYFIGAQQADGRGGVGSSYRFMSWDPEGYSTCHQNGMLAWPDPFQIAYCAEARLDHKILAEPRVYALFVNQVEEALKGRLARDRVQAALERTRASLHGLLVDPAVCAAMVELRTIDSKAADCAVARTVVTNRVNTILAAYDARVMFLLERIKAYRAKP